MNSEELEQSLRTEFESFLKEISANMQREATEFQEKIEAEVERHKALLTEVFQDFSARVQIANELDAGFKDSVVEHLRLARDEGARITATAIGEAEEMQKAAAADAAPVAGISELRNGINDISSQNSQASILKSLVEHAGQFTPRGAFFIIKNEHFVGWRVFGSEEHSDDQAVREVFFPVSADSTLGESVKSLSAVEGRFGTHKDDSIYLDKLEFGEPDKMFAIPLVARGRGVAVLYADRGDKGEEVNVEALETLVRVAGMTVEILAASPGGKSANSRQAQKPAKAAKQEESAEQKNFNAEDGYRISEEQQQFDTAETPVSYDSPTAAEPVETASQPDYQYAAENESASSQSDFQPGAVQSDFNYNNYAIEDYSVEEVDAVGETPVETGDFQPVYEDSPQTASESYSWNQPAETTGEFNESFEPQAETEDEAETYQPAIAENDYSAPLSDEYQNDYSAPATDEYQFKNAPPFESAENPLQENQKSFEISSFETAQDYSIPKERGYDSFEAENGAAAEKISAKPAEAVAEPAAATKPVRSRFSDKNVDLPIEVTEDERRLHNDARRFARLLVSEIKLYNEQKVKEGRDGSDLYERLREAIDRSREMYDKRIQAPVAAKFDYFHYEVVNTLAEGDEAKLGESYPGATV